MEKMTKKDYFMAIREVVVNANIEATLSADMVSFIDHQLDQLNKRTSSKTQTATQKANEVLMETIVSVLTACTGEKLTIKEIQDREASLSELSNQKMSALLKKLVDSETVQKEMIKKKAFFFIEDSENLED